MPQTLDIAFFGSSLVSAYWNGAATYFRGVIAELHRFGHRVTFYEPDAYERQQHRDIGDPDYARSVVYAPNLDALQRCLEEASHADVVIKASGVGIYDVELEAAVLELRGPRAVFFWDVDAPATLSRLEHDPKDPFCACIPHYTGILTYGGGPPVVEAYTQLGASQCVPIYNALDPRTHHPVEPQKAFEAELAFAGNRLPDRESRVRDFFFSAAEALPAARFLLAGNGWDTGDVPALPNVRHQGHLYTHEHNAFNASPLAVLNVCRESMARMGYSPPTRVFEACGAGACLITDAWEGLEQFLVPGQECLVAENGQEVAEHLKSLTHETARQIGQKALARLLREHTYAHRAARLQATLQAC